MQVSEDVALLSPCGAEDPQDPQMLGPLGLHLVMLKGTSGAGN